MPKHPQTQKLLLNSPAVGDRVGIVLSADEEVVRMVGYGERLPDSVPAPSVLGDAAHRLRLALIKNPTLKADNGTVVWGVECWWGPEKSIRKWVGERRVITVTPPRSTDGIEH